MNIHKLLILLTLCVLLGMGGGEGLGDEVSVGPLFERFRLTFEAGVGTEAAGPLWGRVEAPDRREWRFSPILSRTVAPETDSTEWDFLYPVVSYDQFGKEYRFQLLQWFSFSGGQRLAGGEVDRFSLFPFYFQQRSADTNERYTALVPFYGNLKNRFFRDEVHFVMLPLYVRSRKRDVITDNFVYPFFHLRRGEGLKGWQFWPVMGREHKEVTEKTNQWGEVEIVSGHKKFFFAWPIFFEERLDLGTENPRRHHIFLPFYRLERSPLRDSSTWLWPLGPTFTDDREKQYREWGLPWPVIVFARGEGKRGNRVWPLFSHMETEFKQSDFALWPVYKRNRITSEPLDRDRVRLLFFLYSRIRETNTETGTSFKRWDLWPLLTAREDHEGRRRVQLLAPLEPLLPNSDAIERNYSPLWSLWRSESDPESGVRTQSLLWNLYRRDERPEARKCSLLFGLFQYESRPAGRRWRLFYIPFGKKFSGDEAESGDPAEN